MSKFLSFLWEVVLTNCTASSRGPALFSIERICNLTVPLHTFRVKVECACGHLTVKWWALLNKLYANVPGII